MVTNRAPFRCQARIIQTIAHTANPITRHGGTIGIDKVVVDIDINVGSSLGRALHDPWPLWHGCGISPGIGIGSTLLLGRVRESSKRGKGEGRREGRQ